MLAKSERFQQGARFILLRTRKIFQFGWTVGGRIDVFGSSVSVPIVPYLDSRLKIGAEHLSEPPNKEVIGGCGGCELEDLTRAEQDESCTLLESLRFGEYQKSISADRIQSLSSARIVSGTIE